jgi:hypothetical protein
MCAWALECAPVSSREFSLFEHFRVYLNLSQESSFAFLCPVTGSSRSAFQGALSPRPARSPFRRFGLRRPAPQIAFTLEQRTRTSLHHEFSSNRNIHPSAIPPSLLYQGLFTLEIGFAGLCRNESFLAL